MASLNKIILIGRLTADPELKYTEGGSSGGGLAICTFSLAVDRPYSKSSGQAKKTDFFRCKVWRQTAEFVQQYVQKGRLIALEGRVELNEYTDREGQRKWSTDVIGEHVEILDSNKERDSTPAPADEGDYGAVPARPQAQSPQRPAASRSAAPAQNARRNAEPGYARPVASPAGARAGSYPTDDDFDDSDPFADD